MVSTRQENSTTDEETMQLEDSVFFADTEQSRRTEKTPEMPGHLLPLASDSQHSGANSMLDDPSARTDIHSVLFGKGDTVSRLAGIDSRDDESSLMHQDDGSQYTREAEAPSTTGPNNCPRNDIDYDYVDSLHSRLNSTHFRRDGKSEDYLDFLFEKIESIACETDGEAETIKDILDEVFEFLEDAICGKIARERNAAFRHSFESFLQRIDRLAALAPKDDVDGEGQNNTNKDLLDILCNHIEKLSGNESKSNGRGVGQIFDKELINDLFAYFDGCVSTGKEESAHERVEEGTTATDIPNLLSASKESRDGTHQTKQSLFKITEEGSSSSDHSSDAKAPKQKKKKVIDKQRLHQEMLRRNNFRRLRGNVHGNVSTNDVVKKVTECCDTVHEAFGSAGEQFTTAGCQLSTIFEGVEIDKLWDMFVLGVNEGTVHDTKAEDSCTEKSLVLEAASTTAAFESKSAAEISDELTAQLLETDTGVPAATLEPEYTPVVSPEERLDTNLDFEGFERVEVDGIPQSIGTVDLDSNSPSVQKIPLSVSDKETDHIFVHDISTSTSDKKSEDEGQQGYDVVLAASSEETYASGCGSRRSGCSSGSSMKRFRQVSEMKKIQAELKLKSIDIGKLTPNSNTTDPTCDESVSATSDMGEDSSGRRIKEIDSESSRFGRMEMVAYLSVHGSSRHAQIEEQSPPSQVRSMDGSDSPDFLQEEEAEVGTTTAVSLDGLPVPNLQARPDKAPEGLLLEPSNEFNQSLSLDGPPSVVGQEMLPSIDHDLDFGKASNRSNRSVLMQDSVSDSACFVEDVPSVPHISTPESITEVEMSSIPYIPTAKSDDEEELSSIPYIPTPESHVCEESTSREMMDEQQARLVLTDSSHESTGEDSQASKKDKTDEERNVAATSLSQSRLMRARAMPSCVSLDDEPGDEGHQVYCSGSSHETLKQNNTPPQPLPKASSASTAMIPAGFSWYDVLKNLFKGGSNSGKWVGSQALKAMMFLLYLSVSVASSANDAVKEHLEKRKRRLAEKMTNDENRSSVHQEVNMTLA